MARVQVIVATYAGKGGPRAAVMGGDGFEAGPTDAGKYVLASVGKHSSSRYRDWSRIRWGSLLRERGGQLQVQHDGRWVRLGSLTPVTREQIMDYHQSLYGTAKIPERWVFNDFGHVTCYFFKDRNGNRQLDANEKIHGEFFHTTPPDEAATAQGLPVTLAPSHGCIHVKPVEIDEMIKKGYMKRGNTIEIHSYDEGLPALEKDAKGTKPFEVHFYPGRDTILILGSKPPAPPAGR
jgi:hypothetical protein